MLVDTVRGGMQFRRRAFFAHFLLGPAQAVLPAVYARVYASFSAVRVLSAAPCCSQISVHGTRDHQ